MLTARYERLGLERGDKILDLGCGFGRHAFEAARRGADVIALDAGRDEVEGVKNMFAAMVAAGDSTPRPCTRSRCRATRCTCRSPTRPSTG